VVFEVFGHAEASQFIFAEDLSHLFVRLEILLVLGVLKLVLLDVGPQLLHAFTPSRLFLAHDIGQFGRQLVRLRQSGTLGHFDIKLKGSKSEVWVGDESNEVLC